MGEQGETQRSEYDKFGLNEIIMRNTMNVLSVSPADISPTPS